MGQPVYLIGSGSEIGALQGQLCGAVLRERIGRVLIRAEKSGTAALLRERAARLQSTLEAAAPHWIEEARAMAHAAEVEAWAILAFNGLPMGFWGDDYRPAPLDLQNDWQRGPDEMVSAADAQGYEPTLGGDCTAYFALGEATIGGETIFHKNRDSPDEIQNIYIKHCAGQKRFVGAGDIGNLGTAHLFAEGGWAGANNTGSRIEAAEFRDCALNDCHVLRWLGEHCRDLDEIVPALQTLFDGDWMGGGGFNRGSIWLFADAARGLVVEATSHHMAHQWFEGDEICVRTNHFLLPEMTRYCRGAEPNSVRRFERASELWEEARGVIGLATAAEIGRDRQGAPDAICVNPSDGFSGCTVSTSTVAMGRDVDTRGMHFRNCHPSYTHAIIVSPFDRVSDSDLLSGAHNQHWRNFRGWV